MTAPDPRLAMDIAFAASQEGLRSIVIKIETLPIEVRPTALMVALGLIATKALSMSRIPGFEGLYREVMTTADMDSRNLADILGRHPEFASMAAAVRSAAQ